VLELNAEGALQRVRETSTAQQLYLACDASATGYGALLQGDGHWKMAQFMSEREVLAVQRNELSSTVREVTCFLVALQELQRSGRLSRGMGVQVWTDSQAAYADCVRMQGPPTVFCVVKDVHLLA
jgi:ribonuclease HI